jgi:hypothetical protein
MPRSDLQNATAIYGKGLLFLVLAAMAAGLLIWEFNSWRSTALLLIAIWAFCRAYYFAFYVIEHYVDGKYHYAGLIDFVRYLAGWQRR